MDRLHQIMLRYVTIVVVLSCIAPLTYFITGSLIFVVLFNSFNFALNVAAMVAALDALRAAEPLRQMLVNAAIVKAKPTLKSRIRGALFKR